MRQFYENWAFLEDANSTVTTVDLPEKTNSTVVTDELPNPDEKSIIKTTDITNPQNSAIAITELKLSGINLSDFPVEDFLRFRR